MKDRKQATQRTSRDIKPYNRDTNISCSRTNRSRRTEKRATGRTGRDTRPYSQRRKTNETGRKDR
jgi:hypothetical protein